MKMQIFKEEISSLVGKFIITINNNEPDVDITKSNNPEFWLEKRIHFISRSYDGNILINGFYYNNKPKTLDEFLSWFNKGDNRHNRLLNSRELDWLLGQIKKRNY